MRMFIAILLSVAGLVLVTIPGAEVIAVIDLCLAVVAIIVALDQEGN